MPRVHAPHGSVKGFVVWVAVEDDDRQARPARYADHIVPQDAAVAATHGLRVNEEELDATLVALDGKAVEAMDGP